MMLEVWDRNLQHPLYFLLCERGILYLFLTYEECSTFKRTFWHVLNRIAGPLAKCALILSMAGISPTSVITMQLVVAFFSRIPQVYFHGFQLRSVEGTLELIPVSLILSASTFTEPFPSKSDSILQRTEAHTCEHLQQSFFLFFPQPWLLCFPFLSHLSV